MSLWSPKVNEPEEGRGFWGVGRACKNPPPTHPPKGTRTDCNRDQHWAWKERKSQDPSRAERPLPFHRHAVRNNSYCCMLPRFLWFVMHRKLTNTENTEQFGLAGEKDICLKWTDWKIWTRTTQGYLTEMASTLSSISSTIPITLNSTWNPAQRICYNLLLHRPPVKDFKTF